jgi:hypothetical protein
MRVVSKTKTKIIYIIGTKNHKNDFIVSLERAILIPIGIFLQAYQFSLGLLFEYCFL